MMHARGMVLDDDPELGDVPVEIDDEPTLRTSVPLPPSRPGAGHRGQLMRQAALGALAAALMHDLASLIQAMEGAREEVETLIGAGGPPGLREATEDAISAGREAEGLFLAMRRFLRDGDVVARPVGLDRLVHRATITADAHFRRVSLRVGAVPQGKIAACEPLLVQVLVHLLRNAAQSSPPGGGVDLTVEVVEDRIAFHVVDDGPGAPMEVVDHLDDPWQLGEYESMLGLSIAAFVLQSHGGALRYQAEPGRGGRFTAIVPRG